MTKRNYELQTDVNENAKSVKKAKSICTLLHHWQLICHQMSGE